MNVKTILVPTDFSEDANEACLLAREWARSFDAKLHLVHAYYLDIPPTFYAGDTVGYTNLQPILDPMRENAESAVEDLVKSIDADGIESSSAVVMGHPAEVILDEIDRAEADLIIMGTRGLTGLKHIVLGSTAERIVRMASCPVMTIKAKPTGA